MVGTVDEGVQTVLEVARGRDRRLGMVLHQRVEVDHLSFHIKFNYAFMPFTAICTIIFIRQIYNI